MITQEQLNRVIVEGRAFADEFFVDDFELAALIMERRGHSREAIEEWRGIERLMYDKRDTIRGGTERAGKL